MEPDQDPYDFVFVLDVCRDLLEEMRQTVHDERTEDTFLQVLSPEYERVGTSYEKQDFGLGDIRQMVRTMFVDSLSRFVHSKPVADHGIAMQEAEKPNSEVRCSYRTGVGYPLPYCTIIRAKYQRHGSNWWGKCAYPLHKQ